MSNILPFLRPAPAASPMPIPAVPRRLPLPFLGRILPLISGPAGVAPPVKPLDPPASGHPEDSPLCPGDWKTFPVRQRIAFGLTALNAVRPWLGIAQGQSVADLISTSEERDFFIGKMLELSATIAAMPATRGQEDVEDSIVHLHYFSGGYDAWITEKDIGHPDDAPEDFQCQMFGYARFAHMSECAELGYISLRELRTIAIELDFHWAPTPLSQVKAGLDAAENPPPPVIQTPVPVTPPDNPLAAKQVEFIAMADPLQPGAILASSWGYDQTNVSYYRIVKRTKAFVEIEQLDGVLVEQQFMSGISVPIDRVRIERGQPVTLRRKLQHGINGCSYLKIESYASAYLWDGQPKSCSWYA